MLAIALVIIWAMVLGISTGLALIAIPIAALALHRYDLTLIDRLVRREAPA